MLADGSVLATGGNSSGAELVDMNAGVYPAELWNPASGQWKTLASMQVTRQYHSTALLLPDGRVLSAGGGVCGVCDEVGYLNKNAEIFSPPYLFTKDGSGALAPRPTVSAAPGAITEGTQFTVSTPDAASIRKVALVKLGAVTTRTTWASATCRSSSRPAAAASTSRHPRTRASRSRVTTCCSSSIGRRPLGGADRSRRPAGIASCRSPRPVAGGWTFNGSAALSGSEVVLTGATNFQRGDAVWPDGGRPTEHDDRIRRLDRRGHGCRRARARVRRRLARGGSYVGGRRWRRARLLGDTRCGRGTRHLQK